MRIVVTGASGNLGRLTAGALLERVPAGELILVSRSPQKLADFARRGAIVRHGDFSQPGELTAAFGGAGRALVISTLGGDPAAQHEAAFAAAARAGVGHIVYTSVPNPVAENPFPPAAAHRASEEALRAAGVAWTILRNALYADLRVQIARRYIGDGRWTTNMGEGRHAFVRRQDCALAAAAALTDDGHEGRIYDITGPELVDSLQYAALLAEFGGRPVTCVRADDRQFDQYRSQFVSDPRNAPYFELFTGTGTAIRGGYLSQLSTAVQDLCGRPPASLRGVFGQHRAVLARA